jgi:ATP phosphoribosyltransferase
VDSVLKLALPKGRMQEGVFRLLAEAGIAIQASERGYRPRLSIAGYDVKILKPQNIVEMLHFGLRDIGFAGADWVAELGAEVDEVLDTGLDPVQLVAAAPSELLGDRRQGAEERKLPDRRLVVASEYEALSRAWVGRRGLDARIVRSYGATEVFPPEDADVIVDNTTTGSTLKANGLEIVDVLMKSSTRLYARKGLGDDPRRAEALDALVLLLRAVLEARRRVMIELNVSPDNFEKVVAVLPCMREPTVSTLHGDAGFAVKAAVLRAELPALIPRIKQCGGSDIVVTALTQIVP